MNGGQLVVQVLLSLIGPTGIVAIFLIRQQRANLAAQARATGSQADETDAKAEVLLSGEALELFRAARVDQAESAQNAREARTEAARCRRTSVELWAAIDAFDRHVRQLEHALEDAHLTVPARPATLSVRLLHDDPDGDAPPRAPASA